MLFFFLSRIDKKNHCHFFSLLNSIITCLQKWSERKKRGILVYNSIFESYANRSWAFSVPKNMIFYIKFYRIETGPSIHLNEQKWSMVICFTWLIFGYEKASKKMLSNFITIIFFIILYFYYYNNRSLKCDRFRSSKMFKMFLPDNEFVSGYLNKIIIIICVKKIKCIKIQMKTIYRWWQ